MTPIEGRHNLHTVYMYSQLLECRGCGHRACAFVGQVEALKGSKSTLLSILSDLKAFFTWLACEKEYRRRLKKTDADYFNLTEREGRITRARLEKVVPTLEDVQRVIKSMPFGTDIERRDRTLVAFILLTAGRDGAVVTLKLKHIDVARQHVRWDAREVATKFRKSFDTYFYPVGDDMRQIVEENGSRSWRRSWGGGGTIP